jgi:hypothetical protein
VQIQRHVEARRRQSTCARWHAGSREKGADACADREVSAVTQSRCKFRPQYVSTNISVNLGRAIEGFPSLLKMHLQQYLVKALKII